MMKKYRDSADFRLPVIDGVPHPILNFLKASVHGMGVRFILRGRGPNRQKFARTRSEARAFRHDFPVRFSSEVCVYLRTRSWSHKVDWDVVRMKMLQAIAHHYDMARNDSCALRLRNVKSLGRGLRAVVAHLAR